MAAWWLHPLAAMGEERGGVLLEAVSQEEWHTAGRQHLPDLVMRYVSTEHFLNDFIDAIRTGTPAAPDFEDGMRCQEILDAVEASAREERWIQVES